MKTFWSVLISFWFLTPAFGQSQETSKLNVIATNSIVADWVRNVGGDYINLITLVGSDADVHTFEPTPSDNVLLFKADIIFEFGLGYEHWMNKLYAASDSKARRIALAQQIVLEPLKLEGVHKEEVDPHVWHNVRYAIGMVKRIGAVLEGLDPEHATIYKTNTSAYVKQLEDLDHWIIEQVSQIPKTQRMLVTNHDSLGYFCERYQFRLIGAAFDSSTTEAEDPSAKTMADLIFKIKSLGVRGVFAENMANTKFIATLAKEANVQLAPALYTDALGARESRGDTYIRMMQYNVRTIVTALQGTSSL